MYNSSFARLVTNSYEIFYDRTRKMWPFNTGDFFIEVTARAGVIAYTIISRVSIIYGSWMFWHFLLIAGCSLALKAKDDTRLHYTYIVEFVHCDTRVFQHPHVCPVLHVSLCASTSHVCSVLHVSLCTSTSHVCPVLHVSLYTSTWRVCPVLHVSLCTSTSHVCPVLHVSLCTSTWHDYFFKVFQSDEL